MNMSNFIVDMLTTSPYINRGLERLEFCPENCIMTKIADTVNGRATETDSMDQSDPFYKVNEILELVSNHYKNHHDSEFNDNSGFIITIKSAMKCKLGHTSEVSNEQFSILTPNTYFQDYNIMTKADAKFINLTRSLNCEQCNSKLLAEFSLSQQPECLFIMINDSVLLSCIEVSYLISELPLKFNYKELFKVEQPSSDVKQEYSLNGILFSKQSEFKHLYMNTDKTWTLIGWEKKKISLFDAYIELSLDGFTPILFLYNFSSCSSYQICQKAWEAYLDVISSERVIWTCQCGKINETKRCICSNSTHAGKIGWKCRCGKMNLQRICNCGQKIIKRICTSNELEWKPADEADVEENISCKICGAEYKLPYSICEECMNPNESLFEKFKYLPFIE